MTLIDISRPLTKETAVWPQSQPFTLTPQLGLQQDELASFRHRFLISEPNLIYLDGNSLGRLPLKAQARLHDVVNQEWGGRLIRGWNEGWIDLSARIGGKIAALIGAQPDEVLVADSTSVNLYKLALAVLQPQNGRSPSPFNSSTINY